MIYVNKYIEDMLGCMNGINKQEEIEKIKEKLKSEVEYEVK